MVAEVACDGQPARPGERPVGQGGVRVATLDLDGAPERQHVIGQVQADPVEPGNRSKPGLPQDEGAGGNGPHARGVGDWAAKIGRAEGVISSTIASWGARPRAAREPPAGLDPHPILGRTVTETGRLETFADGVFAIAITLLVLAIRLPMPDEDLLPALTGQWPEFAAYVVSFLTIGIMWVQHHRLFTVIRRSNPTFAMINVIFLMFIAFVPFPTAVLAQRLGSGVNALEATLLYGGTMTAIAVMFNAIWRYASSRNGHLLSPELSEAGRRAEARGYRYGVPVYLAITLLAYLDPRLSLVGFLAFAVYWALPAAGPTTEV